MVLALEPICLLKGLYCNVLLLLLSDPPLSLALDTDLHLHCYDEERRDPDKVNDGITEVTDGARRQLVPQAEVDQNIPSLWYLGEEGDPEEYARDLLLGTLLPLLPTSL